MRFNLEYDSLCTVYYQSRAIFDTIKNDSFKSKANLPSKTHKLKEPIKVYLKPTQTLDTPIKAEISNINNGVNNGVIENNNNVEVK